MAPAPEWLAQVTGPLWDNQASLVPSVSFCFGLTGLVYPRWHREPSTDAELEKRVESGWRLLALRGLRVKNLSPCLGVLIFRAPALQCCRSHHLTILKGGWHSLPHYIHQETEAETHWESREAEGLHSCRSPCSGQLVSVSLLPQDPKRLAMSAPSTHAPRPSGRHLPQPFQQREM